MEIGPAFARVVGEVMLAAGVSQAELARRSGIPQRTIRRILLSQVDAKLRQVCTISTALGVPCAEMVARADAMVDHG